MSTRSIRLETAWIEEYTGDGEEPAAPAPAVLITHRSDRRRRPRPDQGSDGSVTRVGRIVVAAGLLLVSGAAPATADPATPTEYRSRIDAVTPAVEGVDAEIVGGDSFLRVEVESGHEVVVLGYGIDGDDPEPYLRFLPDGTVQENLRSEATYLNADRYGEVEVPEGLDAGDEPEWRTIDDDGEYAWHDHRIHWMSPDRRPGIEPGDTVQTQDVSLLVDGTPVAVTVSVVLEHGISPVPWLALGVVAVAAVGATGWRRRSLPVATGAAAVASVLALVVGRGEFASVPSDAGGSPLVWVVPAVAVVAAGGAVALLAGRKPALSGVALLASAAALAGWALLRLSVLWKPVLPTDLPAGLDRTATTLAVAAAVAVAALTLHSGAVTPAPLTDDDPLTDE